MIAAPTLRQLLEAAIESLIGLLDLTDADPDLEEGGDSEPWLGSLTTPCTMTERHEPGGRRAVGVTVHRDDQRGWGLSGHTDAEEQCEDEGEPEWA